MQLITKEECLAGNEKENPKQPVMRGWTEKEAKCQDSE